MNYKKFRDIGDSEPRPWNATTGTKFKEEDEDDDDEIIAPYCDDFDEDTESDEEEVEECDVLETETETETDAESVCSVRTKRNRKGIMSVPLVCIVLHEETDFREE